MNLNFRFPAVVILWCAIVLCGCAKKKEEAPKEVGSQAQVTAALDLIKATRAASQPFLDTHGIMRDNLNSLEIAAGSALQAPGNAQLQRMFGSALNQAIERANIIAKRSGEKPEDKKIAKDLRDKLTAIRKI